MRRRFGINDAKLEHARKAVAAWRTRRPRCRAPRCARPLASDCSKAIEGENAAGESDYSMVAPDGMGRRWVLAAK